MNTRREEVQKKNCNELPEQQKTTPNYTQNTAKREQPTIIIIPIYE
jgi:hypothetical protein